MNVKIQAWDILIPRSESGWKYDKLLDTVFFDKDMDIKDVKRSLIDHDGFPSNIELRRRKLW